MVRFYKWLYENWPPFAARFRRYFPKHTNPYASPPSIEELIAAINANAVTARHLINSLLAVAVALGAVIIGTTDEALLYDRIIILRATGITASPVTVYALAPLVVLFLHGMAILRLNLIARRMNMLEQVLRATVRISSEQRGYRLMLNGFGFVQILVSEAENRNVLVQRFMIWIATTFIPVLVLLAMQISFVRYQHDVVTGLHRFVLLVDLLFLIVSYILRNRMSRPRARSGARRRWPRAG